MLPASSHASHRHKRGITLRSFLLSASFFAYHVSTHSLALFEKACGIAVKVIFICDVQHGDKIVSYGLLKLSALEPTSDCISTTRLAISSHPRNARSEFGRKASPFRLLACLHISSAQAGEQLHLKPSVDDLSLHDKHNMTPRHPRFEQLSHDRDVRKAVWLGTCKQQLISANEANQHSRAHLIFLRSQREHIAAALAVLS